MGVRLRGAAEDNPMMKASEALRGLLVRLLDLDEWLGGWRRTYFTVVVIVVM
jgi:hypothetical protein